MNRIFSLYFAVMCFAFCAKAQNVSVYKDMHADFDTIQTNNLLLSIDNQNFFRNDEYFGDYVEGYTLLGYSIEPALVYYPSKNFRLRAGLHLLQYGGTEKYDKVLPVISANWHINDHADLIMGCLKGNIAHNLPEQILDEERQYTKPVETGVQFLGKWQHFRADVWINWHQFIHLGDTIPEKFMAGISTTILPSQSDSKWQLEIPLKFTVQHIGGQISNYDQPMQSLANANVGVLVNHRPYSDVFNALKFGIQGMFFHDMTDKGLRLFSDGYAVCPEVSASFLQFNAGISYWMAHNFYAPNGNPLYMSVSSITTDFYSKNRNILSFNADYTQQVCRDLRFSCGAKGYYDTDTNQFEYYYGMSLVFTPTIKLLTIK